MIGLKIIIDYYVTHHVFDSDDTDCDSNEFITNNVDNTICNKVEDNIRLNVNNTIPFITGVVIAGLVKRPIPISVKKSILNSFK